MIFVVCQTLGCQQTYPLNDYPVGTKNVDCEECGGVVVDMEGRRKVIMNIEGEPVAMEKVMEERRGG